MSTVMTALENIFASNKVPKKRKLWWKTMAERVTMVDCEDIHPMIESVFSYGTRNEEGIREIAKGSEEDKRINRMLNSFQIAPAWNNFLCFTRDAILHCKVASEEKWNELETIDYKLVRDYPIKFRIVTTMFVKSKETDSFELVERIVLDIGMDFKAVGIGLLYNSLVNEVIRDSEREVEDVPQENLDKLKAHVTKRWAKTWYSDYVNLILILGFTHSRHTVYKHGESKMKKKNRFIPNGGSVRYSKIVIRPTRYVTLPDGKRIDFDKYSGPIRKVRGHLKYYSDEHPMFGRSGPAFRGIVWVEEYQIGEPDGSAGMVIHEYSVAIKD